MKSRQKDSGRTGAGARRKELKLKMALAQRRAEATKTHAQTAKAGLKSARKAFKKAKKQAKEARKKLKALKKALLKAVRAAQKRRVAARKKALGVSSPKPVITKTAAKKPSAARVPPPKAPKQREPGPRVVIEPRPTVAPMIPVAAPPAEMPRIEPTILFPDENPEPKPPAA
ncbi:MAG TPA: hypothetical protein VGP21_08035 [Opitutaceae bacterium]|jgi:hypothetical protein|nr:hypothetical protein [Opitutaceae bacterium]